MLRCVQSQGMISRHLRATIKNQSIRVVSSNAQDDIAKPIRNLKKIPTLKQKIKAYAELSKFRLSSLVVVTTGAGILLHLYCRCL